MLIPGPPKVRCVGLDAGRARGDPRFGRLAASGVRGPLESGGCGKCRPLELPALAGGLPRDLVLLQRPAADPGVWSPSHELFENGAVALILEGQSPVFRRFPVTRSGWCVPAARPAWRLTVCARGGRGLLAGATLCPVNQYLLERSWLYSSSPSSRCYCGGHISVLRARKWRWENCSLQFAVTGCEAVSSVSDQVLEQLGGTQPPVRVPDTDTGRRLRVLTQHGTCPQ